MYVLYVYRKYDATRTAIDATMVGVQEASAAEKLTSDLFRKKVRQEKHDQEKNHQLIVQEAVKQKDANTNAFITRQKNIYEEKKAKLLADDAAAETKRLK
jgi:uncharacterized membrane protein YheB (UPF0754 family)